QRDFGGTKSMCACWRVCWFHLLRNGSLAHNLLFLWVLAGRKSFHRLGHANKDVTDRYAEQLKEDVEWRKEETEKAGFGFKLPELETVVGLLGPPKQQKSKLKKVA